MPPLSNMHIFIFPNSTADAEIAYCRFNGRYYASKQLSTEFVSIPSWRKAICGLIVANIKYITLNNILMKNI